MKYFLVTGEASGDLHASNLVHAISKLDPQAEFMYTGGEALAQATGCAPLIHYKEMAYMGYWDVLCHLRKIRSIAVKTQSAMLEFAPDVVIPVDYGGFNLKYILPFAKRHGFCVAYYIVPKVWAWRRNRIKRLTRYTDIGLSILPFEPDFFVPYSLPITFVGNPCVDALAPYLSALPANKKSLGLDPNDKRDIVAILAGSRRQELRENLPLMLEVSEKYPDYHFVLAGAPGLCMEDYIPYLEKKKNLSLIFEHTYELLGVARAALVTSGTASLETALLGCPQVVCYRFIGLRLANWIFDRLFPIRFFSLVNLVMDRSVVTELLAADCTTDRIAKELNAILYEGPSREKQLFEYKELSKFIGPAGCSNRAAQIILETARRHRTGRL